LRIVLINLMIPAKVYGQSLPIDLEQVRKYDPMPSKKGMDISTMEVRLKSDVDPKVFEK
jgi:hypothetical protein